MSDGTVADAAGHKEDHHPGPGQYVLIGLILAVLTAAEVSLYYLVKGGSVGTAVANPMLLILSAGKFVLVVLFFMHLKFDNRLFTILFVLGFVIEVGLLLALMAMMMSAPVHTPIIG